MLENSESTEAEGALGSEEDCKAEPGSVNATLSKGINIRSVNFTGIFFAQINAHGRRSQHMHIAQLQDTADRRERSSNGLRWQKEEGVQEDSLAK